MPRNTKPDTTAQIRKLRKGGNILNIARSILGFGAKKKGGIVSQTQLLNPAIERIKADAMMKKWR